MSEPAAPTEKLLRYAVERGFIAADEAGRWSAKLSDLSEGVETSWLVHRNVLTAEQLAELEPLLAVDTEEALRLCASTIIHEADRRGFPEVPGHILLDLIETGGMGIVYRARQQSPDRIVAVKIMQQREGDEDLRRQRFEREVQAVADLSHPGVVDVYEYGQTDGRPYYSMEYVKGDRIDDFAVKQRLHVRQKLELMQRVCEAVAYAHQRGVIHRDLKPGNVLVDEQAQPKVLDFGLAKLADSSDRKMLRTLTVEGQVLGTVAYMAPEQTLGESRQIDVRTDVYALGVMLYELLTGKLPTEPRGEPPLVIMRRIREEAPLPPSHIDRRLDDEVGMIVLKSLEKEKPLRYQSADALAADIRRYLAGEALEAKGASTIYYIRKLAYRHRKVLIPTAIGLAAVIGLTIVAFLKVRAERNAAVTARAAEATLRVEAQRLRSVAEDGRRKAILQNYYKTIRLAHSKVRERDFAQALLLLRGTPPALRGWEWGYLMDACHQDLLTFRGHSHYVTSVAISPDSRFLLSGSYDKTARIWDFATGRTLATLKGHSGHVSAVAFSPDGALAATASWDKTIALWDVATGQEVHTLRGHRGTVHSVAFYARGSRLISGGTYGGLMVWDAASGKHLMASRDQNRMSSFGTVAVSPNGARLATGGGHGYVKVWDLVSSKLIFRVPEQPGSGRGYATVAYSLDGKRIVCAYLDGTVEVRDAETGRVSLLLKGHSIHVYDVAFSPDGRTIVTGGKDSTVRLWDAQTGQQTRTFLGHAREVRSVTFSADGRWIISASGDGTIKVWSRDALTPDGPLKAHLRSVRGIAFSPDGKRLASASLDNTIRIWDLGTRGETRRLDGRYSVAFSHTGKWIAGGSREGKGITLWNAATGEEVWSIKGYSHEVMTVRFSPDDKTLVTGSWDTTARAWDIKTGRAILSLSEHSGRVEGLAFSADGKRLATASYDGTARIWDFATGKELRRLTGHARPVYAVAFSPDGRRLVTGSNDETARVWDVETGQELLRLAAHSRGVHGVAFSPDGKRIVTASSDGTVRVWMAETGGELLCLGGNSSELYNVAVSPDGRRIAAASRDGTIGLWNSLDWTKSPDEIEQEKTERWRRRWRTK